MAGSDLQTSSEMARNSLEKKEGHTVVPIPNNDKSWKTDDEQVVPKNNLPLVFFSLLLATFLVRSSKEISSRKEE